MGMGIDKAKEEWAVVGPPIWERRGVPRLISQQGGKE